MGHTAEIVSLNFNSDGDMILTGSFDSTAKIWEVNSGRCIHTLAGHQGEISSTQFDFIGDYCITGSIDRTCKLWDVHSGSCMETLRGTPTRCWTCRLIRPETALSPLRRTAQRGCTM